MQPERAVVLALEAERPPAQKALSSATASASASTASPGVRRGPPAATITSQNAPAPSPNARPPVTRSRVAAAIASTTGGRSGRLATLGASLIVLVRAPRTDSSVQVSRYFAW